MALAWCSWHQLRHFRAKYVLDQRTTDYMAVVLALVIRSARITTVKALAVYYSSSHIHVVPDAYFRLSINWRLFFSCACNAQATCFLDAVPLYAWWYLEALYTHKIHKKGELDKYHHGSLETHPSISIPLYSWRCEMWTVWPRSFSVYITDPSL